MTEIEPSDVDRIPSLDYAFLASFAGLQPDGTMTAVGMGFLRVFASAAPMTLAVAGRVRLHKEVPGAQITITIATPHEVTLEVTDWIKSSDKERNSYGDDRLQALFVLNTQLPIDRPGLFNVDIKLGDNQARTLRFEVVEAPAQA